MKTICIDCRFWGVGDTGIGRYVKNLVEHLPTDSEYKVVTITKHKFHPYSIWAQFEMLWLLFTLQPDLVHIPHDAPPLLWPGPMVITIHDLIKLESTGLATTTLPAWLYHFKNLGYRILLSLSLTKAAHIFTPCTYWKQALVKHFHLSPAKITVTYEGVDPIFFSKSKSQLSTVGALFINSPFVIYTGNLYPHKNVPTLIKAVEAIPNLTLYIVSARSAFSDRLPQSSRAKLLGRLPDSDVIHYYQQAVAFVTPSLLEGFGLPGLEAMASSCPVIAANASCLPEIYGDAALFFDPHSISDLTAKITQLMSDTKLRTHLTAAGLAQAKKYSWATMSTQTWQIYQNVLR